MLKVAIIHPWFPQYRAPFFESLIRQANENNITVDVYFGSPPPEWGERGDSVTAAYATHLPTRFVQIGSKSLTLKSLKKFTSQGPYDLVVVEQAVRNLETYSLLLGRHRNRIAFWGHGRTYTERVGKRQEALKRWLTLRGKWFFSYTEGGVRAVVDAGFLQEQTTVVQNSIDTRQLQEDIKATPSSDITSFKKRMDLRGKTALFIGGLDHAKRLPFLLKAAQLCHERDSEFRLIVIGDGSERDLIEKAASDNSWLLYLGRAHGASKAQALASADIMMMPGRVGLVAVDSFASGLPIVTTHWPYHAPEFEYLRDGRNSVVTSDDVAIFADGTLSLLHDDDRLTLLSKGARESACQYSLEQMTTNFLGGLNAALRRG